MEVSFNTRSCALRTYGEGDVTIFSDGVGALGKGVGGRVTEYECAKHN